MILINNKESKIEDINPALKQRADLIKNCSWWKRIYYHFCDMRISIVITDEVFNDTLIIEDNKYAKIEINRCVFKSGLVAGSERYGFKKGIVIGHYQHNRA